jgi:SpoVK/Ycf46/Vps4 family AAA+-type ATPase
LLIRTSEQESAEPPRPLRGLLEQFQVPVAVEVREGSILERLEGLRIPVPALIRSESRKAWLEGMGAMAARLNGGVDRIVEHFKFDGEAIRFASAAAKNAAESNGDSDVNAVTWAVCRSHARRSLQHLAVRIEPRARWHDVVLPQPQVETLRQITSHVRQRSVVNTRWGFAERYSRGLGATALFAGSSGTGKTMAAEVIAADLELDLYQIDLASVVSKYIGETEKNLRRIFDAAEESGAVLLFDEADALFGKRSEVRDSHDRYANIEVSYLLQRMEAYDGLAILTTNMKQALDDAFLRRIRFIVQFPFPDAAGRQRIWECVFPAKTPLHDLDFSRLARLNISGGVIRNIATHAAFLAAEEGGVVTMDNLLSAARVEYAKLERPLTASETGGWA